ncbi:MAG: hypothetical protein NTZ97_02010 [Candidatus Moranbacteria bacterium]|nr:hypothetical protein [Candidatus Moranbacteria bacterium]
MGFDIKLENSRSIEVQILPTSTDTVRFGRYLINTQEFFEAVEYVITGMDLRGISDPRISFVESVKKLKFIQGYNANGKRYSR